MLSSQIHIYPAFLSHYKLTDVTKYILGGPRVKTILTASVFVAEVGMAGGRQKNSMLHTSGSSFMYIISFGNDDLFIKCYQYPLSVHFRSQKLPID